MHVGKHYGTHDGRYEENGTRIFPIGIYQVATNYLDEAKRWSKE